MLSPLVLSQLLGTLAVLVHAARAAPEWLAVIAPEALELALAVGTRRVSHDNDDAEAEAEAEDARADSANKSASVLASSLELALSVLAGSIALDGGRTLALEHTALTFAAREWAEGIIGALDAHGSRAAKAQGGGGAPAARLARAAAGVLIRAREVEAAWGRSMVGGVV